MPRCTEYTEDWIDEQRNRSGVENRSNGIGQHLYVSATDDDIMTGAVSDPTQFGEIFDRYYATIHAYLTRRLGRSALMI